jgi:hypothetical protein
MFVVEAMWNADGVLVTATTDAPSGWIGDGATAANGVTAGSRVGGIDWGDALTAPANTMGVMATMPNAGECITRVAVRRTASKAAPPPMCTQTVLVRWLVNQVTIPSRQGPRYNNA